MDMNVIPTSSHMFRNLIPKLADQYDVVAPDLPACGQSDLPSRDRFQYTFDNLARVMSRFTEVLRLEAFKRDNHNAKVTFCDTGHFALETHCDEIAEEIRDFLSAINVPHPSGHATLREA